MRGRPHYTKLLAPYSEVRAVLSLRLQTLGDCKVTVEAPSICYVTFALLQVIEHGEPGTETTVFTNARYNLTALEKKIAL